MSDSDTLRRLWRYKSDLEEGPDEEKLIQILKKLYKLHVSITSLQETGIGKVVNTFKTQEGLVGDWANKVVLSWKTSVQKEIKKQELKQKPNSGENDVNGEESDGSENSWASWDGEGKKKIKQEKHDRDKQRADSNEKCHMKNSSERKPNDQKNDRIKKEKDSSDKDRKHKSEHRSHHRDEREHRDRNHHSSSDRIKKEKPDDKIERKSEKHNHVQSLNHVHVKKEKEDVHSRPAHCVSEDDLTDSDAEPEQETSDLNSIEQYYQTMLGQVKNEHQESESNGHKKSERSKSHSHSGGSSRKEKYSNSSASGGKKDSCGGTSSKDGGSKLQRKDETPVKSKHEDDSYKLKRVKVDRNKKSHSLSDSESDEDSSHSRVSLGPVGDQGDGQESTSSHRDGYSKKESDHRTPQKVSSSSISSSSHHKSSSSHHKSSSSKSSSLSHSHSKSSSSKPSSHSSSKSSHTKSSSSSSSKHAKSSSSKSSSHHSKSSPSSSSYVSSSTHSTSKNRINDNVDGDTVPPYIPTPVKIKTEKDESSALYTPTPALGHRYMHDHSGSENGSDESQDNSHILNRTIKREKLSSESSSEEDAYIPNKKIKKERDSSDGLYSPVARIKREQNLSESEESDNGGYTPSKKIKIEKSDDDDDDERVPRSKREINYDSPYRRDSRDEERTDDSSGSVHRNKYLDAIGRVQSEEGGDEERYSPTYGWKVKEEKPWENDRYGGAGEGTVGEGSQSEVESENDSQLYVPSKKKSSEKRESSSSNKKTRVDEKGDSGRHSSKSESRHRSEISSEDKKKDRYQTSDKHQSGSSSRSAVDSSTVDNGKRKSHESSSHSSKSSHSQSGKHHSSKSSDERKKHNVDSGDRLNKSDSKESRSSKHDNTHSSLDNKSSKSSSSLKNDLPTTSTSKTSGQVKKKTKPKQQPDLDADFDLFSETIQIKKEAVAYPQVRKEERKKDSSKKHLPSSEKRSSSESRSGEKSTTLDDCSKSKYISPEPSSSSKSAEIENEISESVSTPKTSSKISGKEMDSQKSAKKKKESVHIDDSGMSFDDFLNFDEAAVLKKSNPKSSVTKSHSSKKSSSSSSSRPGGNVSSSKHQSVSSSSSIPEPSSTMKLTEADLMSLLPATQAHYRPVRRNPMYDREEEQGQVEAFDPEMVGVKTNVRSKLYSGKKHVNKEMKSLHELCLLVLMDNIDAIDHVGPIPYFILKPVLERCSPEQLYRLEDFNPHFIEDSEELWEIHSKREFMGSEPEEMETWRELFLRKFEEREAKYQKLKAKMCLTQSKGQAGRPAKLAYVNSVAKPPREVLRQQKRHGTGLVARTKPRREGESVASSLKTYKPSLLVPAHNPLDDRPRMKPTPPMLARALQMRKNMRR